MKRMTILCVAAFLLITASAYGQYAPPYTFSLARAWDDSDSTGDYYSIWMGGHTTEFDKYRKKVGEYNLGRNETLPEAALQAMFRSDGRLLVFDGHYYDEKNARAELRAVAGQRFNLRSQYRSLVRQLGRDNLTNLDAKEAVGGKMLSHAVLDPEMDYNYGRQEITSKLDIRLSEKNDLTLVAAHRAILKNGHGQSLSNNHCWGCHVESDTRPIDDRTNEAELGLDATVKSVDLGYQFAYRKFNSEAVPATRYFDTASHPINYTDPGLQDEFGSRLIYDDVTLPVNVLPTTEKMTHKLRLKGSTKRSTVTSVLSYSRTENTGTSLASKVYSGVLNYNTRLSRTTRLLAKLSVMRAENDDPFIELPIFRDGRPGPADSRVDFSYTRYSALDRWDSRLSAELISRFKPKWTLRLLGGYERVDRDDYPIQGNGLTTSKYIGQARIQYRQGLRYNTWLRYRFEKTNDPFTSGRGLFEYAGVDSLSNPWTGPGSFPLIFYHEREPLRYQSITTLPTDLHEVEWKGTYKPSLKTALNLSIRGTYDKNGDLDSLDVNKTTVRPNVALSVSPSSKWYLLGGYTYLYSQSRGPVAVALFDG